MQASPVGSILKCMGQRVLARYAVQAVLLEFTFLAEPQAVRVSSV